MAVVATKRTRRRSRLTPTVHATAPVGTVGVEGKYYAVIESDAGTKPSAMLGATKKDRQCRLGVGGFGDVRLFPRKSEAEGRRSGGQHVARVRVVIDVETRQGRKESL